MKFPWVLYASVGAEALPLIAAWLRRRELSPARRYVLLWCAFLIATNLLGLALALGHHNNHWITYVVTPIAAAVPLWALSFWQTSATARLWLRLLVPLLGIAWIGIVVGVEDTQTFSLVAEPFAGLLVLGGAVFTLVTKASHETGNILRQDWFWVGLGFSLSFGTAVALPPASRLLMANNRELVMQAYQLKALMEILALLAVTVGMLCPRGMWASAKAPSPAPVRHWGQENGF